MKKFPHINQFKDIVARVNYFCDKYVREKPVLEFIGRVKLHGTNVSVRRYQGEITTQSRSRVITPQYDNYGFAQFITSIPLNDLHQMFDILGSQDDDITIFGEFVGKGIQNNVAVSSILQKQWVVFSILKNDQFITDVKKIYYPTHQIYNIDMVPAYNLQIDFNDPEKSIEPLTLLTQDVEQQCPWGKLFHVEGIGEGIVWYWKNGPEDPTMWFKTKGDKHSRNKENKQKIAIAPEKIQSIEEFVNLTVHEDRLQQGYDYVLNNNNNEPITIKNLGTFLKWISQDILREDVDLLKFNDLEWKDVTKAVTLKAKQWFLEK